MTDSNRPSFRSWTGIVAGGVFATVLVYWLSIGPVGFVESKGWIPSSLSEPLTAFYLPWRWVYNHSPMPVRTANHYYIALWQGERSWANAKMTAEFNGDLPL